MANKPTHIKNYAFHRFIMKLVTYPCRLIMSAKFRYSAEDIKTLPEPFILISNHVTFLDMILVSSYIKPHIYYVAGEHTLRKGFASRLLNLCFAPVIRSKGASSIHTVIDILKRLKAGCNIGLFAEGGCSYNGLTDSFSEATGKMIKKAKCSLVTYKLTGGYLSAPRWALTKRKGRLSGSLVAIYSPSELDKMSASEINALIARDISEDAYARQKEEMVEYRGKRLAEGIENTLVLCPLCHRVGTIKSHGDDFSCDCGMHGHYDVFGMLSGNFDFKTITEWDLWQRSSMPGILASLPEASEICFDEDKTLYSILDEHKMLPISRGKLVLTRESLSCGGYSCPLSGITEMATYGKGTLVFSDSGGGYYEIGSEKLYAGRKYLLIREALRA